MFRAHISNGAVSVAVLALIAMLLAGCGVADGTAAPAAAAPTPAPPAATPAPRDMLYVHDGDKAGAERLALIDSLSGAHERDLPPGVVSPDWRTLYAAEQQNGKTSLRALDLASGQTVRETQIE